MYSQSVGFWTQTVDSEGCRCLLTVFFLFEILYNVLFITKAPAKRSQHVNATYRNIVGRNMLRAFGHHVASCCHMLSVVGSNLTIFKLEPTTPNMVAKRAQHVAPNNVAICCVYMLRSFGWGLMPPQEQRSLIRQTCYGVCLLQSKGVLGFLFGRTQKGRPHWKRSHLLWRRANARNVSFITHYGGQFTFST